MGQYTDFLERKQAALGQDKNQPLTEQQRFLKGKLDHDNMVVRDSVQKALPRNPDEWNEIGKLARENKIDPEAAHYYREELEAKKNMEAISRALGGAPILKESMKDPQFASIAHDDINTLAELERVAGPRQGVLDNLGQEIGLGFERMGQSLLLGLTDAAKTDPYMESALLMAYEKGDKSVPIDEYMANYEKGVDKEIGKYLKSISEIDAQITSIQPKGLSGTEKGVRGGVASAINNGSVLLIGALTRNPRLISPLLVSGQVTVDSYGSSRVAGNSMAKSVPFAIAMGASEYVFEKLPTGKLFDIFGVTDNAGLMKAVGKYMLAENLTEQPTTIVQSLLEIAADMRSWEDYDPVAEAWVTFVATNIGAGTIGSVTGTIQYARTQNQYNEIRSMQGVDRVKAIMETAKNSKLYQRAPEQVERLVKEMAEQTDTGEIYLDAAEVTKWLKDGGIDTTALEHENPAIASILTQLNSKSDQREYVVLPIEKAAAYLPDAKNFESLYASMAAEQGGSTLQEVENVRKEIAEMVKEFQETAQANAGMAAEAKTMMKGYLAQLEKATANSPGVSQKMNQKSAELLTQMIVVEAGRTGLSVKQVFNAMGLTITDETTEVEGRTLDQVIPIGGQTQGKIAEEMGANFKAREAANNEIHEIQNLIHRLSSGYVGENLPKNAVNVDDDVELENHLSALLFGKDGLAPNSEFRYNAQGQPGVRMLSLGSGKATAKGLAAQVRELQKRLPEIQAQVKKLHEDGDVLVQRYNVATGKGQRTLNQSAPVQASLFDGEQGNDETTTETVGTGGEFGATVEPETETPTGRDAPAVKRKGKSKKKQADQDESDGLNENALVLLGQRLAETAPGSPLTEAWKARDVWTAPDQRVQSNKLPGQKEANKLVLQMRAFRTKRREAAVARGELPKTTKKNKAGERFNDGFLSGLNNAKKPRNPFSVTGWKEGIKFRESKEYAEFNVNVDKLAAEMAPVVEGWKETAREIGRTEDHSNQVIISLFDFSGVWSQPWVSAGYNVQQLDIKIGDNLLNTETLEQLIAHIEAEGLEVAGIIAAPPSTSFSNAGSQWWKTHHDVDSPAMVKKTYGAWAAMHWEKPLEVGKTLVTVVDTLVSRLQPGFYAMENPAGRFASQNELPQSRLNFDPWAFGDPYTKQTHLWGSFNANLPAAGVYPALGSMVHDLTGFTAVDKAARSTTPEGFAYAFFMGNHKGGQEFARETAREDGPADKAMNVPQFRRFLTAVNVAESVFGEEGLRWGMDGEVMAHYGHEEQSDLNVLLTYQALANDTRAGLIESWEEFKAAASPELVAELGGDTLLEAALEQISPEMSKEDVSRLYGLMQRMDTDGMTVSQVQARAGVLGDPSALIERINAHGMKFNRAESEALAEGVPGPEETGINGKLDGGAEVVLAGVVVFRNATTTKQREAGRDMIERGRQMLAVERGEAYAAETAHELTRTDMDGFAQQTLFNIDEVLGDPIQTEALDLQAKLEGKNLVDAAEVLEQANNKALRQIAMMAGTRIRELENLGLKTEFKIFHVGDSVPLSMHSSRARVSYRNNPGSLDGELSLSLNGADVTGKVGMSEVTFAHELIHAATMALINRGRRAEHKGTKLYKDVEELIAVTNAVVTHFNNRVRAFQRGEVQLTELETALFNRQLNALEDQDEVLAWGMTDPFLQEYFESIPYKSKGNAWTAFVESVRKLLGLPPKAQTALSEIMRVGETLMTESYPEMYARQKSTGKMAQQTLFQSAFHGRPHIFNKFNQPKEGEAAPRGNVTFNANQAVIRMGKAADASTFMHEAAHVFLEFRARMFTDPRVPRAYQRDSEAILAYLGVTSFDEITTEHHEKFAESFERYLMEGKAPSIEARSIFRHFASWLADVYKNWTGPELNPSIRAVFDRMVASDLQIERAQLEQSQDPIFTTAEEAGMTPKEFEAYQKLLAETDEQALEILRHKVMKVLERQTKKWWKSELADMTAVVEEELAATQVYSAIAFLRQKETPQNWRGQHKLNKAKAYTLLGWGDPERPVYPQNALQLIAEMGGIDTDEARSSGIDPAYWERSKRLADQYQKVPRTDGKKGWTKVYTGKKVWKTSPNPQNSPTGDVTKPLFKKGGMSLDAVGEMLFEAGYRLGDNVSDGTLESIEWSETAVMDVILESLAGNQHYSMADQDTALDAAAKEAFDFENEPDRPFGLKLAPHKLGGMTDKNGVDPEQVAIRFGYASAREMLFDIVQAETLKKAARIEAEARMVSKHGDILNDGTLEEETRLAVVNTSYGNKILAELRALARLNNKAYQEREEVRSAADELIESTIITQIRPRLYHKAEVKAAERAGAEKQAGNLEGAQAAAQEQYKAYTLFLSATAAVKRVLSVRERLKQMRETTYSDRTIDTEHVNRFKQVISAFNFSRKNEAERAQAKLVMDDIARWIDERNDPDKTPDTLLVISKPQLLYSDKMKHFDELTFDEMEQLMSLVESIYQSGKAMRDKRAAEKNRKLGNIAGNIKKNNKPNSTLDEMDDFRKAKALMRAGGYSLRKLESLMRQLDGMQDMGPLWRETVKPLLDAARTEMVMHQDAFEALGQIFKGHTNVLKSGSNKVTVTMSDGSKKRMSLSMRVAVALNYGNIENRKALLEQENRGWKERDVQTILSTLTKDDWKMVQEIWDYVDSFWPEIAALEERITGVAPKRVEAASFTAPTGQVMRGGYYPLVALRDTFAPKESQMDTRTAAGMLGSTANAYTKHPWTNERAGFGKKDIELDMEVLFRHIDGVIHDISHREAVRHVSSVIQHKDVKKQILRALGREGHKAIEKRLQTVAIGEVRDGDLAMWEWALRKTRIATTYGALGFSFTTGFKQSLGITTAAMEMGMRQIIVEGFYEFHKNPTETVEKFKYIMERSVVMDQRLKNMNRDVATAMRNLEGVSKTDRILHHSFDLLMAGDMVVSTAVWWSSYHTAMERVNSDAKEDSGFKNEQSAIDWADRMVSRTQQSGFAMDLSGVESGHEWIKNFSTMYSALNAVYNMTVEVQKKYKAGQLSGFEAFKRITWGMVLAGIMEELVFGGGAPDEEDEYMGLGRYAWAVAKYGMAEVIALRDMSFAMETGMGIQIPATKAMTSPIRLAEQLNQGELDKGLIRSFTDILGFFKLPGNQINKMLQFWLAYENGDEPEWDMVEFIITGPKDNDDNGGGARQ